MHALEHSSLLAALYAFALYAVVAAFASLLVRVPAVRGQLSPNDGARYGGIDGLRGLLAVGVFVHHTFAAHEFFTTGRWAQSESAVFNHLGQTTVALFFMVTAFLFSLRLMTGPVNWRAMFVSRFMRLTPLYMVFTVAVFLSAMHFTAWQLNEAPSQLAREFMHWAAYSILARPDINTLPMTWTISAGVTWSLRYEWCFYGAMPLLLLALKPLRNAAMARVAAVAYIAFLASLAAAGAELTGSRLYLLHFATGIAVALLYRDQRILAALIRPAAQAVGIGSLVALAAFATAAGGAQILLTGTFFAVTVAASNRLLDARAVRWLGEISYGIYLLHGVLLYWTLSVFTPLLPGMSVPEYTLLMIAVSLCAVAVASLLHFAVELPGIELGRRWGRRSPPSRIATATAR